MRFVICEQDIALVGLYVWAAPVTSALRSPDGELTSNAAPLIG